MADTKAPTISPQEYADYWQKFAFCQADETCYTEQADYKKNYWLAFFQQYLSCEPSILQHANFFASPPKHFRARIEFATRFFDDQLGYAMFERNTKKPIKIEQCQHASPAISEAMPILMQALNNHAVLAHRCMQINFRCNVQGQLLITLIYRQALGDKSPQFQQQIEKLHQKYQWEIIARSHKKQWACEKNYLDYTLILDAQDELNAQKYHYRQDDNTFTQPNPFINQQMLQWVKNQCSSQAQDNTDLLELYCGNGNFSIALANQFRSVLATEVVRESLNLARYASPKNALNNLAFVRLSAEETAQALSHYRQFRRLRDIDLEKYQFSTVLVDPPRSGIDSKSLQFLKQFSRIIYVSCNPHTLVANINCLKETHQIKNIALFDQFPYTSHLESIVILDDQNNLYER